MVNFWKQSMHATKLRWFRLCGVPGGYYTKLCSVYRIRFAVCSMNCLLQALPFINGAYSGFRCMFWPLFKQWVLHWRLYLPSAFFFVHFVCTIFSVVFCFECLCRLKPQMQAWTNSQDICVRDCSNLPVIDNRILGRFWDGQTKVYWRWWHESMQEIINKWTIYIKFKIKKNQ